MSMKENQSMRILFSVCFIVLFVVVIVRQKGEAYKGNGMKKG